MSKIRQLMALLITVGGVVSVHAKGPTTADLEKLIGRQNESLPRVIAPDVRQEKVSVSGLTLINRYTMLSATRNQLMKSNFENVQRRDTTSSVCKDPFTSRILRDGVSFRYMHYDKDNFLGSDFTVSLRDCATVR